MDKILVTELSKLICLHPNEAINHKDRETKINGLLCRKSNSTVIRELSLLAKNIPGQNKNKIVLIVVLALLRRNLDCVEELKRLLIKYNLVNPLFVGIKVLLSGKSKTFGAQIKWSDNTFENKYEWLERFKGQFQYFEFIELFQAIKILHLVEPENIEKIVKEDKTRLVLLNILSWHFDIAPSDRLIEWLLKDSDELNQNIGFHFLTNRISYAVSDIWSYQSMNLLWFDSKFITDQKKKHRENLKLMNNELPRIEQFLSKCNNKTKTSLLMNYIVTQRQIYPAMFARWLIETGNQEYLVTEIKNSGKLRTLQYVHIFLYVVAKTKRKRSEITNSSKMPLYNAIVDKLIDFIKSQNGIYEWGEQEQNEFSNICIMLPSQSKKKLSRFLQQELETLAICDIDRLLRYKIYLEDERKYQIINGMLNVLHG